MPPVAEVELVAHDSAARAAHQCAVCAEGRERRARRSRAVRRAHVLGEVGTRRARARAPARCVCSVVAERPRTRSARATGNAPPWPLRARAEASSIASRSRSWETDDDGAFSGISSFSMTERMTTKFGANRGRHQLARARAPSVPRARSGSSPCRDHAQLARATAHGHASRGDGDGPPRRADPDRRRLGPGCVCASGIL